MKKLIAGLIFLVSNAHAIENVTATEVAKYLGLDRVEEISREQAQDLIWTQNPAFAFQTAQCLNSLKSRSARAYVGEKRSHSYLFVTSSGLRNILDCGKLR